MEKLIEKWNSHLGMVAEIKRYDEYLVLVYNSPTNIPMLMLSFELRHGEWELHNITSTLSKNNI